MSKENQVVGQVRDDDSEEGQQKKKLETYRDSRGTIHPIRYNERYELNDQIREIEDGYKI